MLHGDYVDGTRFWGEGVDNNVEAVYHGPARRSAPSVVITPLD